jgi:hypothetical protein
VHETYPAVSLNNNQLRLAVQQKLFTVFPQNPKKK